MREAGNAGRRIRSVKVFHERADTEASAAAMLELTLGSRGTM